RAEPGGRAEVGRRHVAQPQARGQRRRWRARQEAGPPRWLPRQGLQEVAHGHGPHGRRRGRGGGRQLRLSNLEKVLYPAVGFTKGQVIDYYTRIAPVLLPHLKNRPLTLKRYPNGVDEKFFYEKQAPSHRPDWVKTVPVVARERTIDFTLAGDLPTLVWLANLADLELHTSLSLAKDIPRPSTLAFDLDPGPPATIVECADVALLLRELFESWDLVSVAKTSGSKGMQLYVPLNTKLTYDDTKPFAKALAELLAKRHPDLVVSSQKKELRKG